MTTTTDAVDTQDVHVAPVVRNASLTATPTLLIVTPAKNEADFIQETIDTVTAQTVTPTRWIIVNDGSTDETGALADAAAAEHDWIHVVHRASGERVVGRGVVDAVQDGLDAAEALGEPLENFDFFCKLDADLRLAPNYFAELYDLFAADPRLGTVSGKCFNRLEDGRLVDERIGDDFSLGAAKLYRRECFEEIGGFVRGVMWDGIDCHRCRMLGWVARSVPNKDLRIVHLRQMGSSHKSIWHGRCRWGRGQYFMGTHPIYLLGIATYRMFERPWVLGGLGILWGYTKAALTRETRYDVPGFRKHLHRWQFAELKRRFLRR